MLGLVEVSAAERLGPSRSFGIDAGSYGVGVEGIDEFFGLLRCRETAG